jgi:putative flippase GtrA
MKRPLGANLFKGSGGGIIKLQKEIFRFCVTTMLVAVTDLGGYYLLKAVLPPHPAKGISFLAGSILAYVFSKYWTFKKKRQSLSEMGRYWIGQSGLLAWNVAVNAAILGLWPRAVFAALAVTSTTTLVLSYVTKKWWVFRCP